MKKIILLILLSPFVLFAQDSIPQGNQRAWYPTSVQKGIDSTTVLKVSNQVYFQFHPQETADSLTNFSSLYRLGNPDDYFFTYLVNTTDSSYSVELQDGSLIMIQEAINENGNWMPIEYWVYSGCGNSYFNPLKLESGKTVKIPTKKYSGDFKTQVRLKFRNRTQLIYSDPFETSINKSLFKKETGEVHGILYHGHANYLDDE